MEEDTKKWTDEQRRGAIEARRNGSITMENEMTLYNTKKGEPMMLDVIGADIVQIRIAPDGKTIWVNTEDGCRLRICQIERLDIVDDRPKENARRPSLAILESKEVPSVAMDYNDCYTGYDHELEGYIFEFVNEYDQIGFLEKVGGIPHPYGGLRVLLTT